RLSREYSFDWFHRNMHSRCKQPHFQRASIHCKGEEIGPDPAVAQQSIALGGSAVADDRFAVISKRLQKLPQLVAIALDPQGKFPVRFGSRKSSLRFLIRHPTN